jgi:excisionase family DNA binding protein
MISVKKVAEMIGMSERFVYDTIEAGKLAAFKFGGSLRVHISVVTAYIDGAKYDPGA